MLSYSRGALLALRRRARVLVRGRAAAAARRGRAARRQPSGAAALVALGVHDDRPEHRQPADRGARRHAATSSARCCCCCSCCCSRLGLAAGFLGAERPASPRTRSRRRDASCSASLAAIPVILLVALASAPGGIDGQVSKAWDQLTNPNARHAGQHAEPPDRHLLGARALLGGGVRRARASRPGSGPARAPTRRSATASGPGRCTCATPTATCRRRWRTSAGPGSRCRCSRSASGAGRRCAPLGLRRATAGCRGTPSASAWRR